MPETTSIIAKLQLMASDSAIPVPDILRKALIIATKLKLTDFKNWIFRELNGYESNKDLPEYRIIRGTLKAHNPFHGLIPWDMPPEMAEFVEKLYVSESINSLCQIKDNSSPSQTIMYPFPRELEAMLYKFQGNQGPLKPYLVITHTQLSTIIESVRTQILEWALKLETSGIHGHGITFSDKEIETAQSNPTISISNFQGILGNISNSTVTQNNNMTITPKDFSSLAGYLKTCGLSDNDIAGLRTAINDDPIPISKDSFGSQVSAWLGSMYTKAANGTWNVALNVAGTLLAAAIAKYYGLN